MKALKKDKKMKKKNDEIKEKLNVGGPQKRKRSRENKKREKKRQKQNHGGLC